MNKVFIGGSRRLTRLSSAIRERLNRIIENGLMVLIGDANGADKAVQQYLKTRSYEKVEVFCSDGVCRNNMGGWPVRKVKPPRNARGFEFYAAKDKQMTEESSVGFMLWDGQSKGTQANIFRLLDSRKKVVVYVARSGIFLTLRGRSDWESLQLHRERSLSGKSKKQPDTAGPKLSDEAQVALF